MRLFMPLIRSKFIVLFLVVLFIKSFILPYSIFAGEKKGKNSKGLFSVSVWSSERLVIKETTKNNLLLTSNVFTNNTHGLSTILYQKPPEGEPIFVKKKGSNRLLYIILGIAAVGGVLTVDYFSDKLNIIWMPKKIKPGTAKFDIPWPE